MCSHKLHFHICKENGVNINEQWYGHVPKLIETSHEGKVTMLWSQLVQTDGNITNNKPDSIMRGNEDRNRCVAVSAD